MRMRTSRSSTTRPPASRTLAHTPSRGIRSLQRRSANGSPSASTLRRQLDQELVGGGLEPRFGADVGVQAGPLQVVVAVAPRAARQRIVVDAPSSTAPADSLTDQPSPGPRRGELVVTMIPARPVSTSVTTRQLRVAVGVGAGLGDLHHPAVRGLERRRVGGQPGQLQLHRRGDLEGCDLRQRPQVRPVADGATATRIRCPAGNCQPAAISGSSSDRLAVHRQVHGGAGDVLRGAVGRDVLELDRHQRARAGMPQRNRATGSPKTASGACQRGAVEGRAERVVAALVEELAGGRRRRAPLAGHDARP